MFLSEATYAVNPSIVELYGNILINNIFLLLPGLKLLKELMIPTFLRRYGS
jgi:hypothetical protein